MIPASLTVPADGHLTIPVQQDAVAVEVVLRQAPYRLAGGDRPYAVWRQRDGRPGRMVGSLCQRPDGWACCPRLGRAWTQPIYPTPIDAARALLTAAEEVG